MVMRNFIFFLFILIQSIFVGAQSNDKFISNLDFNNQNICTNCVTIKDNGNVKIVASEEIDVNSPYATARLIVLEESAIEAPNHELQHMHPAPHFQVESHTIQIKGQHFLQAKITPYRLDGNNWYKLLKYEIIISNDLPSSQLNRIQKKTNKKGNTSPLNSGTWNKISVKSSGLHSLTYTLMNQMGWKPDDLDINKIAVFGNAGGMLPERLSEARPDGLKECRVEIKDVNGNGKFNSGDAIIFYAEGPDQWKRNPNGTYTFYKNDFDNKNYYFVTLKQDNSLRLPVREAGNLTPNRTVNTHLAKIAHENNEVSISKSGRLWLGDAMNIQQTTRNYPNFLPDINGDIELNIRVTAASVDIPTQMNIYGNGNLLDNITFKDISGVYSQRLYAILKDYRYTLPNTGNSFSLKFDYNPQGNINANGYIDRFEIVYPRKIKTTGSELIFDYYAEQDEVVQFDIENLNTSLWDVTDPNNTVKQQSTANSNINSFIVDLKAGNTYSFLIREGGEKTPEFVSKVENQNLHALDNIDYLILSHPAFIAEAELLANFHRNHNDLSVQVVDIFKIYNEFSSGRQDVTALRDFIKMVYDRNGQKNDKLSYVLMFGDASYDYLNRVENNTNVVPTYQSYYSSDIVESHCSDDYFAILDDGEGRWGIDEVNEGLDVGIGRIPVMNNQQAFDFVSKIIRYHTPETHGDWRGRVTFIADDEDGNQYFSDAETFSTNFSQENPEVNINKIYLDAYKQESFGSGDKYPDVNEAIDRNIENGALIINYMGHGGVEGMAHERVVTLKQIQAWENEHRMPLIITATCELSRFDDPSAVSPGELMLRNLKGGSIGLISTTRIVYTDDNTILNRVLVSYLHKEYDGRMPTLGEIYLQTKNHKDVDNFNHRNFILLGDPAMTLAYPENNVVIDSINGQSLNGSDTLSVGALGVVSISGHIENKQGGVMTDYFGELTPTVFDKPVTLTTLGNDEKSTATDFQLQNSVLYKGKVTIENGKFHFNFIMPKDISYVNGLGKLSLYATNFENDALGFENRFYVNGTANNPVQDNEGPKIDLFMEDTTFVDGGLTSRSPLLIAHLSDDQGINTVGNGIGHDLAVWIDRGTDNEKYYIVNEFYIADLNSYRSGKVNFSLSELKPGKHTLHMRAWDVLNNSSTESITFFVSGDTGIVIQKFINYPNPFLTETKFTFDHNKPGERIATKLQITNSTGKVILNKTYQFEDAPAQITLEKWGASQLRKGFYIATLQVFAEDGSSDIKHQKMIKVD